MRDSDVVCDGRLILTSLVAPRAGEDFGSSMPAEGVRYKISYHDVIIFEDLQSFVIGHVVIGRCGGAVGPTADASSQYDDGAGKHATSKQHEWNSWSFFFYLFDWSRYAYGA